MGSVSWVTKHCGVPWKISNEGTKDNGGQCDCFSSKDLCALLLHFWGTVWKECTGFGFCSVRHEIKLREDSVTLGQNVLARTATGTKKDTLLFPPPTSSALNTLSSSNKMCTSSPRSYLKAEVDLLDPRRSGLVNHQWSIDETKNNWSCRLFVAGTASWHWGVGTLQLIRRIAN